MRNPLKIATLLAATLFGLQSYAGAPRLPIACELNAQTVGYQSLTFRGLLDLSQKNINYYIAEIDKDGKTLFSDVNSRPVVIAAGEISLSINNGSVVRISTDIARTIKPVRGTHLGRMLKCQVTPTRLEAPLPPTAFEQIQLPQNVAPTTTNMLGFKQKTWVSTDGKLKMNFRFYPTAAATPHLPQLTSQTEVLIDVAGLVSGPVENGEVDINYVFYNPNNLASQRRVLQAALQNPVDAQALKKMFQWMSGSGVIELKTFFGHTSPVALTIDCSSGTKCVVDARN